ncbi:hypothetical protein Drorol1_Dr00003405 [Drosera rotundifolia]
MERPAPPPPPPPKTLTPQEFETLISDFHHGDAARLEKWTSQFTPLSLLVDLALSSLLKPQFSISLKLSLLVFLDEFSLPLFSSSSSLSSLVETLALIIHSSEDAAVKEQMMVTTTSIIINLGDDVSVGEVEGVVAVLLNVINRPNHGFDRGMRGVACECLRELEREWPCLLEEIVGNLWGLCQSERTHVSGSYLLLLLQVVRDLVVCGGSVGGSGIGNPVPLVPFNVPLWLRRDGGGVGRDGEWVVGEVSGSHGRELRWVLAFVLEWPHLLTPSQMMEFMTLVLPIAGLLELQASMLRVQFAGLMYSFDPLLAHAFLFMYFMFPDAFDGQEGKIARRLILMSKEGQRPLVFRLLALHWLIGFAELIISKETGKKRTFLEMGSSFYPNVFDALALKSLKLDLLAFCAICVESVVAEGLKGKDHGDNSVSLPVKYLEDGLVCVSAFKWLPAWSTETAVTLRTFHKFLIGVSPHSDTDSSTSKIPLESTIFVYTQKALVNLVLGFPKLVPVVVVLVDRLLNCQKHCWLGEKLLQKFDQDLLPKLVMDHTLTSYFPIFDKIGRSDKIPPTLLLELLTNFMIFLVKSHGPDTGLKTWSQGSRVLSICRTMLMHHQSSRLFTGLSHLLAFSCLYFPDLEVRDNARIYLRMLICIPGKKLRHTLNLGEQLVSISPSPHSASFFNVPSPRFSQDPKKSKTISSYMHFERVVPLLVKQSWSLALPALTYGDDSNSYFGGIRESGSFIIKEPHEYADIKYISEAKQVNLRNVPLRVMDAKVSETLGILRTYFSCIPDFRHMKGIKIKVSCTLRFESNPFKRIWGVDSELHSSDEHDVLPAIYATVLNFSSSAPYGPIPACRIPFLLGQAGSDTSLADKTDKWDIVPVDNGSTRKESSKAHVTVELEPREPIPGLVDVLIESNSENGQVISGQLSSLSVGIEDMFLRAILPSDITGESVSDYYSDLYDALWEACGGSSNTGREMFLLKGAKGAAAISGTQSVKLLEVSALHIIHAVEQHLSPFVVSVIGESLVKIVKDGGIIQDATFKDYSSNSGLQAIASRADREREPLYLTYFNHEDDNDGHPKMYQTNVGWFLVLIFLPPRYHLLFRMEVSDFSTLVRIRTDHWPSLAYVDDYLEALFSL